jgi:hypothetical protein
VGHPSVSWKSTPPLQPTHDHHPAALGQRLAGVLAGRLEDASTEALATFARTQRGPAVVPLQKGAGR